MEYVVLGRTGLQVNKMVLEHCRFRESPKRRQESL